jgi:pimeloyl-ACP methyl ester carboxylesterase
MPRVEHLVLIGSGGLGLGRPSGPMPEMARWRGLPREEIMKVHRANLAAQMIHDPAKVDPLAVRVQFECTAKAKLRTQHISRGRGLRDCLERIPTPLSGLWGEEDISSRGFTHERRELIQGLDSDAEFVSLPVGHWMQYEAADEVNAALLQMLTRKRVARGRSA